MSRERAHQIFATLAVDLARTTADYPGQILCPLCIKPFDEAAIDLELPALTIEHIIPDALGGRIETLSCKTCNSTHGAEIDSHLIEMVRSRDIFEGKGSRPMRGQIEVGGIRVPTDIDFKAPVGERTTFELRQFDPVVHREIRERLDSGSVRSIEITMLPGYSALRACLGVLRAGYLALFHKFGYDYILSAAVGVVRNLIADFDHATDSITRMVMEVNSVSPMPSRPIEFFGVTAAPAIAVLLRLTADTTRYYAAFLPLPDVPPEEVIATLCAAAESHVESPGRQSGGAGT